MASNISFPGGNVDLNNKEYSVRTSGRFEDIKDIENVVVRSSESGDVLLKDVALIEDTFEERDVFIHNYSNPSTVSESNDKVNTLVLTVLRKDNADEVKIKESVEARIEASKDKILPNSVSLELISDKADYVDSQLGSVTDNASQDYS